MGNDKCNINSIMKKTGTVITFPETSGSSNDVTSLLNNLANLSLTNPRQQHNGQQSQQRKTTVNIKGSNLDTVFMAFQSLLKFLPLSLTFDLKDGQELDPIYAERLSQDFNIIISAKPKPKQNIKSIWIKAAEKDASALFEARRHILQLNDESNIWAPNEIDFALFNDNQENKGMESGFANAFNKAPGAERSLKAKNIDALINILVLN